MLTRFERGMLEQERDLARANGNLDLFLKTSCVLRVSEGHFQREVADMFGVPLRTLESWIEQYRNSGMSGLIKGPYSGKQSRLTPDQLRELAGIIEAGPETAGFETGILDGSHRQVSGKGAVWRFLQPFSGPAYSTKTPLFGPSASACSFQRGPGGAERLD
jgi:transposase